jgi:N-acyl-D-amino-acid deacylase
MPGRSAFPPGLFYPTNKPAPKEEVIALAELLAPVGGIYTTHMRDEADDVEKSLDETFATARRLGCPSSFPITNAPGGQTGVAVCRRCKKLTRRDRVSPWPRRVSLCRQFHRAHARADGRPASHPHHLVGSGTGNGRARFERDRPAVGLHPTEAAARLQPAGAVYFQMDEADVQRILAYPHSMVGSDGLPHDRFPHPRFWGAFPRVLGHYVRDVGLFSLEEAVHRMTGLSAAQFRLRDRGVLQPGNLPTSPSLTPTPFWIRPVLSSRLDPPAALSTWW